MEQLLLSSVVGKTNGFGQESRKKPLLPVFCAFSHEGFFPRNEHFCSFLDLFLPKRKIFDCMLIKLMLYSDLVACADSIVNDNLWKERFCVLGGLITSIPTCLRSYSVQHHEVCSAV